MGYLDKAKVYLCGGIDLCDDCGIPWRRDIRNKTRNIKKIKVKFFDPTDKPNGLVSECGIEKNKVNELKKAGMLKEAGDYVKRFRRYDLRMVDFSDFLIIKIDLNYHLCGSYFEVETACRQQKPVFAIIEQGRNSCPNWLLSYLKPEEIFNNVDECVYYLVKLDKGEIPLDDRWVIIDLDEI